MQTYRERLQEAASELAGQVITGIEPQQLRDSVRLRQMVARDIP